MKLSLAKIISFIFHPMVALTLTPFLLIYKITHDLDMATYWTGYTLVFILLFISIIVIATKKRVFTDLDVSKREQRPLLNLIGGFVLISYVISLYLLKAPFILYLASLGVAIGVIIFTLVNRRIKASFHVGAVSALILPVAVSYGHYYLLLLLLIPLLVWARLKTKRHTVKEIIAGGSVGGFLSLSFYYITRYFLNK